MSIYEKYLKLITKKIERGKLTPVFIAKTTKQLDYYLDEDKIEQEKYDELITLLNAND